MRADWCSRRSGRSRHTGDVDVVGGTAGGAAVRPGPVPVGTVRIDPWAGSPPQPCVARFTALTIASSDARTMFSWMPTPQTLVPSIEQRT